MTAVNRSDNRVLYWMGNDLRLHDNAALVTASESARSLTCVYCLDAAWLKPDHLGLIRLGKHRRQFLEHTLTDLAAALEARGQTLLVLEGNPVDQLTSLIRQQSFDLIVRSQDAGHEETGQWQSLQRACPEADFISVATHSLFEPQQLPFLGDLPATFSRFRKQVESIDFKQPIKAPDHLPPPLAISSPQRDVVEADPGYNAPFHGGESTALKHLQTYLSSTAPRHYRDTRNALQGWSASSKVSAWLANGSLSVRSTARALRDYEQQYGTNDSTYWLYFELLWREYFHWYARQYGARLFRFKGIGQRNPLTSFYPERFRRWCRGSTPWPLVNACMAELNQTGYLSNRGRQIAASCLVNELALDWRCGAAYFEQQLVDYDVASNWGNWQYIAGVGADPRGGRHFNLEKQRELFDPDGDYIKRWGGDASACNRLDSVDAADWPIRP